jgi:hypothetical protein
LITQIIERGQQLAIYRSTRDQDPGEGKRRIPMNKTWRELITFAGVIAVCSAPLFAQNSVNLTATVPFAFHAGSTWLPAGHYRIYSETGSPILTLRAEDGQAVAMILSSNVSKLKGPKQSELEFRVYGEKHYFAGLWSAELQSGRETPKTAAERESERAGIPMQVAVIPPRGR